VPVDSPAVPNLTEELTRLAAVADAHGVRTLVLREPATLAWLFGARVHVPQTLDTACLDAVVDCAGPRPRVTVVTNTIEAPRLRDTELAGIDVDWCVLPWWEPRDQVLPRDGAVGADRPLQGAVPLGDALAAARRVLTRQQRALLGEVCAAAAAAATATAHQISPTTTEYQAAGVLAHELLDRALDPIVLFAAGDERIGPHRHPLPTTARVGRRAMLVCCARRHGLVASVTRTVAFGPLRTHERASYDRLLRVEQAFLDATRPGARLGDAFTAGVAAYAANGFPADEWHRHHQGGFSGYQPREFPAHTATDDVIQEGCVVAWNPSGAGWKVEDTCLVGATRPEPLVRDASWPTVEVGGRPRPDVLVR
jgi:peptidase M24-like protein